MQAGDNITLTAINRRFRQLFKWYNSLPADKIKLTTRQIRVIIPPDEEAELLNTSTNQTLPFFENYIDDLFAGR